MLNQGVGVCFFVELSKLDVILLYILGQVGPRQWLRIGHVASSKEKEEARKSARKKLNRL